MTELLFCTVIKVTYKSESTVHACRPSKLVQLSAAQVILLRKCCAFSGRSRPPMMPVFSIISSFLYLFIFHLTCNH